MTPLLPAKAALSTWMPVSSPTIRKSSTSEPSGARPPGPNAGAAAFDVFGADLRNEPLERFHERVLRQERTS